MGQNTPSVIAAPSVILRSTGLNIYFPYYLSSQIMFSHIIPGKLPERVQCNKANDKVKGALNNKIPLAKRPPKLD